MIPTILLSLLRSKIGLVGLCVIAALAAGWWHGHAQYNAGYQAHETEMAVAAARAEKERISDDDHLNSLSDRDLCVEYLGARGLPVVGCDKLRRVPAE
jgi:hypothetical protein